MTSRELPYIRRACAKIAAALSCGGVVFSLLLGSPCIPPSHEYRRVPAPYGGGCLPAAQLLHLFLLLLTGGRRGLGQARQQVEEPAGWGEGEPGRPACLRYLRRRCSLVSCSASGASVVAIDNKIEQAMVSVSVGGEDAPCPSARRQRAALRHLLAKRRRGSAALPSLCPERNCRMRGCSSSGRVQRSRCLSVFGG